MSIEAAAWTKAMATGRCRCMTEWIMVKLATIMDVGWTAQVTIGEWITVADMAGIAAPFGITITRSAAATEGQ
jgi:hypothetical protein